MQDSEFQGLNFVRHGSGFRKLRMFLSATLVATLLLGTAHSQADETFWTDLSPASTRSLQPIRNIALPKSYRALSVDLRGLNLALDSAGRGRAMMTRISLPHPKGGFKAFDIYPSDVMSLELVRKYPEIRAFKGRSVDQSQTTVQLEVTPRGVTAQVLAPGERWAIDPLINGRPDHAVAYFAKDTITIGRDHKCLVHSEPESKQSVTPASLYARGTSGARAIGQSMRTYRLAVATTGEYTQYHGGTKSLALSAVTTTVARVAGIYEKELAVSFTLIDITDIIFLDPATDNLTNNDGRTLIGESQTVINNAIGAGNYDVGHTFSTGGGGLATLRTPCKDSSKARGITGRGSPIGDPFDVDYVAHEIGHQFGGNHTYNGTVCTTGNSSTAYEPGSGSTIQAYAGICGSDNLQSNSDPIFAAVSFDEMIAYVEDSDGDSCDSPSPITNPSTGATNNVPSANAGSDYSVPRSTALILNGSATDSDGDSLTYLWEQRDLGPKVALGTADNGTSPLFRVLTPVAESTRYLPKLSTVVAGIQDDAEIIPSLAREMDFRLTARDGHGGVASDDMMINVVATPSYLSSFSLSEPTVGGESLGSNATVRWNVADTNSSPISADTMDFYLSTDGGVTFSVTPFDSKPNTGYARVTFPSGVQTATARLMIRAQNNIFYDVSNANFTLDSDAAATPETPTPVTWSLVPADGGAELYFGDGPATGGSAGIYQGSCRPSADEFDETVTPATAINDNQTTTSTITIDALGSLPSSGIALDLDISHTYRGDLTITVTSPAGTSASIATNAPNSGADVQRTGLILDEFAGEAPEGVWTLSAADGAAGDQGTLNAWGLSGYGSVSGSAVTSNRDRSPIYFTGLTNDWPHVCEVTAFDNSVTPSRGSATVAAGSVTPSSSPTTHTLTPSSTVGGSVAPADALPVATGNRVAIKVTADSGYQVDSVGGTCGGALSGSTYTTDPISSDCTVAANFTALTPGTPLIDRTDYGDGEITLYVSAGAGGAPTSYEASCSDGANIITGTSTTSPITVSGLTNGTAYTCTVTATNAFDTSASSSATAAITPEATSGLPIWLLYQATQ